MAITWNILDLGYWIW